MASQIKKRLRKGKDKVVHVVNDLRKEIEDDKDGKIPLKVRGLIHQARDLLIDATNKLTEAIHE